MRIGHGYDVHKLVEGRKLIMGGVEIPYEKFQQSIFKSVCWVSYYFCFVMYVSHSVVSDSLQLHGL